ncbi:MAG: adenosylcobalamin-dependent ribonucleoside-diphosphate reductase [bacterium]|nr:adenosylcobalamin-dependent ribonucleoside-diphosphate reductase [bacterium]
MNFKSFKTRVVKRSGREEPFSRDKVKLSIFAAAAELGGKDLKRAEKLAKEVEKTLQAAYGDRKKILAEEIGDVVEIVLIKSGHAQTAKQYILSRAARKKVADLAKQIGVVDDVGGFSLNALVVMKNKYLLKDEDGEVIETPRQMFHRVAKVLVKKEKKNKAKWLDKFLEIMVSRRFLPAGRTLTNTGTKDGQMANCFVLPMNDSVTEIFEALKESAILKKHGGSVGFSLSKIRPKGDYVSGSSGRACGPVAIMKLLNDSSDILIQHGKRRAGNMVTLNVTHPDILEFITCKEDQDVFPHINFSLAVTSKFMKAVIDNQDWPLINPRNGEVVSTLKARSILELAATYAWHNGDPGLIFIDEINKNNPTPDLGPIETVNLCGEQPLLPYEACNLGSINLTAHLKKAGVDSTLGQLWEVDWDRLAESVRIAVRMLDNVVSVSKFPLKQVSDMVLGNRKIGLGVIGWGDVLMKMGLSYKEKKARKMAEKVMQFIQQTAWETSAKLGEEKGSFPNFKGSVWDKRGYKAFRNATMTTIAPTGSISILADASYGIEPLFALSFYKEAMGGVRLPEVNQDLFRVLEHLRLVGRLTENQVGAVKKTVFKQGSIQDIEFLPKRVRDVFVTAMDINLEDHILMQAAFQKYTDNGVSKTINMPNEATVDDVIKAFILAWKMKCKGITVYRDGSRQVQVLNVGDGQDRLAKDSKDSGLRGLLNKVKSKKGQGQVKDVCPACGSKLYKAEGCSVCNNCGFSVCSV